MALPEKSSFWRNCRIAFRRFRICSWLLILVLLGALLYLNQIGLPGFMKKPLLKKLRARGLDLQFTRLRWRWDHGIVAENVHFGRTDDLLSPKLVLKEVEVQLNYRALAKLQFQVDSLILRRGSLTWPVSVAHAPARELSLTNIQTQLRLLPGDLWELDHFEAQFAGGDIRLTGVVTNASAVREWKLFHRRERAPLGLHQWAETLEQIHFSAPPQLRVDVQGDARELQSFAVDVKLDAPGADTPWGTFQQGRVSVQVLPADSNDLSRAEVRLQADSAQTPWAAATNLALALHLVAAARNTNTLQAQMELTASRAETEWGSATNARLSIEWIHSFTNAIPPAGRGRLELDQLETRWGNARNLQFTGNLSPPARNVTPANASWGWWTNLAPYALTWEGHLTGLRSTKLEASEVSCAGQWTAPDLHATQLSARLYGGKLDAEARLSAATREFSFAGSSDFDLQRISGLLTEKSRNWLSQYSWEKPPTLQAEGSLVMPEWTNPQPDWRLEVKPTVRLNGHFHVEDGAFRGVPATTAEGHFSYTNEVWRVPDLVVVRPEGRLNLVHESDERTRNYYFRIHSTMDVRAFRPLLEPNQQRGFDLISFTQPPVVDGEIRGRWYEHERLTGKATVVLTNFAVRGESIDRFQAALEYTNGFLLCVGPHAESGSQHASATSLGMDFAAKRIFLTNGVATADPLKVTRMIGPKVNRVMEPYRFVQPATARVNGIIPMQNERDADLHFEVEGGPFEWLRFKVPRISGKVDWVKDRLLLRDIQTEFYRGVGIGNAQFDFRPQHGTDFSFHADVNDVNLHLLMDDLSSRTNRLEGILSAQLGITHANSVDGRSWQGSGHVTLRDGLIWEIPVFGILSPVLDAMMPGLGSSRASEGSATFNVTNSIIASEDLEIRASMMRLRYWGTVDLAGQVNAHAEAELLRDTWMVGRVLSLALWPVSKLFEYQITGTLHEPRSEPVFFVPRLVLLPLHPIRTLKDLAPDQPDFMQTNAPPAATP